MKSLLSGTILTLFLTNICFAQWFWQNPIPGNTFGINKIKFFDENNGMVIGTEGTIYMTTNGGTTWGATYTGESGDLIDIGFSNDKIGIAITDESVLKTTDGGLTWNKINQAGSGTDFQRCAVADSLHFFVAVRIFGTQTQNFVLITNDGGNTWQQSSILYGMPYELYFINNNLGLYIIGNKLYRTTNGGMNWTFTKQFPALSFYSISFCDSLNGIMMNLYAYKTNDGGLTWDQVSSPDGMFDVLYYSPELIIAVGAHKSVYKSTDLGSTWTQLLRLSSGSSDIFNSISVINDVYYITGPGTIYKSLDSGANWFSIQQGTTEYLYSIDMPNRNFGITVGGNGTILTTHNSGATWESKISGTDEYLYSVACIDTLNALAVGYNGTIIKTTNGGESWEPKVSGVNAGISRIEMLNQSTGLAVGSGGILLKTTDGGDTWQHQVLNDMRLSTSRYIDSSNIFIGGNISGSYGYILRSQDAGINWDTVYQMLYNSPLTICRLGTQSLIATCYYGLILKSTDMGSTWSTLNSPRQYHCYASFIDSLNGLLCFMDGYIYRTTNGGNSWNSEWPYYSELRDIQMLNINDAVAVGFSGAIISTITDHIMPVELISFSGYSEYGKVYLNWQTASELNNLMFEIERREITDKNEGDWIKIGYRTGSGTTSEITNYSFVDDMRNINSFTAQYRLKQIDFNGDFSYSDIIDVKTSKANYQLLQNFPNPFNPITKIRYSVPSLTRVQLKVFDILGAEIATLVNEDKPAGNYELNWNPGILPTGVYFYQLKAGDFVQTRKMILLK